VGRDIFQNAIKHNAYCLKIYLPIANMSYIAVDFVLFSGFSRVWLLIEKRNVTKCIIIKT